MWKLDHKNLIHSKSKQLHFNIAQNECDLKWMWCQLYVVSNECGLKWMWSQMNVVSNECGLKWMWSQMNVVSNDCGLKWSGLEWMWSLWSQMNGLKWIVIKWMVSNECGLKWMVSNECSLKWLWSQKNVVSNECGHKWMWLQMNVVSNECGLKWMVSNELVSNICTHDTKFCSNIGHIYFTTWWHQSNLMIPRPFTFPFWSNSIACWTSSNWK